MCACDSGFAVVFVIHNILTERVMMSLAHCNFEVQQKILNKVVILLFLVNGNVCAYFQCNSKELVSFKNGNHLTEIHVLGTHILS